MQKVSNTVLARAVMWIATSDLNVVADPPGKNGAKLVVFQPLSTDFFTNHICIAFEFIVPGL